jgi:T5SS/PEP-CTERM-associated repeat protein
MHQMRRKFLIAGLVVWVALGPRLSEAQYTNSFQTNLVSGVISNLSGSYIVGSNKFADVLLVKNGGVLSDTFAYLGYEVASSNNSAVVSDADSVWSTDPSALGILNDNLYIGYRGAGNRLTISNGGYVVNASGIVGFQTTSTNNSVLVTDSGSVWSNSGFVFIGYFAAGNTLVISNGGQVFSSGADAGVIGLGQYSSNNTVLVTGTNSLWNNWGTYSALGIGNSGGANNNLVISNAALVISPSVYVSGGSNCVRVVDGGVWQTGSIYLGFYAGSNSLVVGGGSVFATNLVIGFATSSCDNLVQVDAGSLIVTDATADATLEVGEGRLALNGGVLQVNRLVITNACASFVHTGGTLIVDKLVLDPNAFRIVSVAPESNNIRVTWMMGPGATNALQVTSGAAGSYNTNGFTDLFVVTNNPTAGAVTNYLDVGAATKDLARYYRVRLVP